MRLFVLFILVLGATQASEALASESSPIGEAGQAYEVRPRDRLERVAAHFGVTIGEIISANPPRAFIRECVGQRELTLRNGETITVCRRVHYGLIAGKTLIIPVPRLIVESENVRLDAENTALEAERDQAERESDLLKQERDALRAERDELKRTAEAALREKAEIQGRYDELKQASAVRPENNVNSPAESKSSAPSAMYNREAFFFVILAIMGCSLIVIAHRHFTRPGLKLKRSVEELRRERANFEIVRSALAEEGKELAERRRRLDAEDLEIRTQRSTLERDQESLRTQRDELGKWEESLKARAAAPVSEKPKTVTAIGVPPIFSPVPTGAEKAKTEAGLLQVMVARGRQLLEEDFRTLAGREAACTAREKAIERRVAALDSLRQALEDREKNLTTKEHGVEELRRTFSSGKARCDLTDIAQTEREENLVKGFADLTAQRDRLDKEFGQRQIDLDRRATEIDGKVRMYDEDIAPAIKKAREDLAAREAAFAERERGLAETERSNTARAEKLSEDERAYERRMQELKQTGDDLDLRAEKLGEGEQKLSEEQLELKNNRDAFANEVDAAKGILTRAKRKKEIVATLEEREAEVARRERECEAREGTLQSWSERLSERERKVVLAELPTSGIPHRPTLAPAFPPLPLPGDITPGTSADDDNPTVTFQPPTDEEIDPRAATHIEMNPGPAMVVDSVDIEGERVIGTSEEPSAPAADLTVPDGSLTCRREEDGQEVDLASAEAHIGICRSPAGAESPLRETGPHIPVAAEPMLHSESSFWCSLCKRDIPMDDMDAHQKLHQEQENHGPLGQG